MLFWELIQTIQLENIIVVNKDSVNLLAGLFGGSSADAASKFGRNISSVELRSLIRPKMTDIELSRLAVPAKIVFERATCAPSP
jgi:hypothetical protein